MIDAVGPEVLGRVNVDAAPVETIGAATDSTPGAEPERRDAQAGSFERLHADMAARLNRVENVFMAYRLADLLVLRRRGIDQRSRKGAVLTGLMSGSVRLTIPLALTAVVGQWSEAPVWRWMVIAVTLGLLDIMVCVTATTYPFALRRVIVRESDLRRIAAFDQRGWRLRWSALTALTLICVVLLLTRLIAHTGLNQLPVGSSAVLLIILYEVGELAFFSLYHWLAFRLDAKVAHRLPWFSPVDSMAVQSDLRAFEETEFARGLAITVYLAMTVVLLSIASPLLLPIAVAVIVTGYITTFVSITAMRADIREIVRRVQEDHLALLRARIASFGTRPSELSSEELEQVQRLIAVYNVTRDAPTSPSRKQSLSHAVQGLAIPTVTFLAAVFAQEYAGRILDQVLP